MNAEGVKIRYGDVAPEAKENFQPFASSREDFVNLGQLQQYNLNFPNYANPCEYGSVLLDSTAVPFPSYPDTENMGLWSKIISGADGTFATPITLTLTADGQYSSQGFTLTFDTYNNIFCNSLSITWYRNSTQIETADFTPNSPFYFCRKKVDNFDKAVIVFKKMNMPYNRLKLRVIDYGYGTFFRADELRGVNVIQEINPIMTELSINTVDFTLDSKTDMDYSFQAKQPLEVYFNGQLRAVHFVNSSKRQTKTTWSVETEDYIGQLAKFSFMGDVYTNKNAAELLASIFSQVNIPYSIADNLKSATLTGYIPICDCREAVRHICFAIGAVCTTANSDKVKIYKLPTTISQNIPLSRIYQGQSFSDGDLITSVAVTSYEYKPWLNEEITLYNASESGLGEEIFVKFSEPMHDLSISYGEILKNDNNSLKCSANYAIIKATDSRCELTGYKYGALQVRHEKKNELVLASDLENVYEVTGETLINSTNADSVLTNVFNFVTRRAQTNMSIVEGKKRVQYGTAKYGTTKYGQYIFDNVVEPGDIITAETEYLGNVTGYVISERYNLNGGILVKECEVV